MKNKSNNISATIIIVLIVLFYALCIFKVAGQTSVPDELPVQLTVVQTVVGSTGLDQCFTDATESYFDPTYSIPGVNRQTEFRNYGSHNVLVPDYYTISSNSASSTNTLSVSYGSTSLSGNLMILVAAIKANTTISTPSGWTSIGIQNTIGLSAAWFYKEATGETGSVTINFGSSANVFAAINSYEDVYSYDFSGATESGFYGNSISTNSILPSLSQKLVFVVTDINESISLSGGGVVSDRQTGVSEGFRFVAARGLTNTATNTSFTWTSSAWSTMLLSGYLYGN